MSWTARDLHYRTIDPLCTGETTTLIFPGWYISLLIEKRPVDFKNLVVVKQVLDSPTRIYHNTRRLHDNGYCYVGKPQEWHVINDVTAPFPNNFVYAVYCNNKLEVYTFRAELADEDGVSPKGWEVRYGRCVWKARN